MIKKIATLFFVLLISANSIGQEQTDQYQVTNNIIFGEASIGFGNLYVNDENATLINLGLGLNYQYKRNLFTLRYNYIPDFTIGFVFVFPVDIRSVTLNEYAFLYGRRWLYDGSSISISGGVSLNQYRSEILGGQIFQDVTDVGIPLEFNVRWFKKKKRTFRALYGLVPVGKPTTFGRGLGIKVSGNIAKRGFVLVGFTYSLGTHKYY